MQFIAGLLISVFSKEVVAKLLVVLLKRVATLTPNTIDDELVQTLEERLKAVVNG